jgi:Sec-independent protein translocase protein TatA
MDFAFSKLALIAMVGLLVIGPKDLPRVARQLGRALGKVMAMRDKMIMELREGGLPFEAARQAGLSAMGSISQGVHDWGSQMEASGQVGASLFEDFIPQKKPHRKGPQAQARAMRAEQRRWRSAAAGSRFAKMAKLGKCRR